MWPFDREQRTASPAARRETAHLEGLLVQLDRLMRLDAAHTEIRQLSTRIRHLRQHLQELG